MGKTQNQFDLSDFSFMEYFQSAVPWLFRKRKLNTFESRDQGSEVGESPKKKQRLDRGVSPESYLMMAARRSYTSVVSWLFPQISLQPKPTGPEIVDIEDEDDEIRVLEVVDGKKSKELSSKNIKYDPLPSFKGFTRPPKRRKVPEDEEDSKEEENLKSEVKLQRKTKSRLSKMLKSREIYRKMLEQKIKSNQRLEDLIKDYGRKSENMNRKLKRKLAKLRLKAKEKGDEDLVKEISETNDEFMKEHSEKNREILEELSKQGSELRSEKEAYGEVPEVVNLDTSDDEGVKPVEDDVQVLDDLANIELVKIEDSDNEDAEVVEVTDESDYETDEDEAYYDNRTFVRKECDIVYDPDDDSFEEEEDDDVKILENFPEIVTLDDDDENEPVTNSSNEVLVTAHRISITGEDLQTLEGLNWLNDNIVNFYMAMIEARSRTNNNLPLTYAFSTFFYPRLQDVLLTFNLFTFIQCSSLQSTLSSSLSSLNSRLDMRVLLAGPGILTSSATTCC